MFGTQRLIDGLVTVNLPMEVSSDLTHWVDVGDALPTLPSWARPGGTWAPSASKMPDGTYRLYFAALADAGQECIGVATSATILGPYVPAGTGPLECQASLGGSLDPAVYVDSAGARWLTWKNDGNAIGRQVGLWSSRLSADGLSLAGQASQLLTADAGWEQGVIENPNLVTVDGVLDLFYSGGVWSTASYATGYATCQSPAGPCTNRTVSQPLQPDTWAVGNGSLSTFTLADGRIGIAWSAWLAGQVGSVWSRWLFIGHIRPTGSGPQLIWGLGADPSPPPAPTSTTTSPTTNPDLPVKRTAAEPPVVRSASPVPIVETTLDAGHKGLADVAALVLAVLGAGSLTVAARRRKPRQLMADQARGPT